MLSARLRHRCSTWFLRGNEGQVETEIHEPECMATAASSHPIRFNPGSGERLSPANNGPSGSKCSFPPHLSEFSRHQYCRERNIVIYLIRRPDGDDHGYYKEGSCAEKGCGCKKQDDESCRRRRRQEETGEEKVILCRSLRFPLKRRHFAVSSSAPDCSVRGRLGNPEESRMLRRRRLGISPWRKEAASRRAWVRQGWEPGSTTCLLAGEELLARRCLVSQLTCCSTLKMSETE